jgi:membrane-associated phospholipid phosphatase
VPWARNEYLGIPDQFDQVRRNHASDPLSGYYGQMAKEPEALEAVAPGTAVNRTLPWDVVLVASILFTILAVTVCLYGRPYFAWDLAVSRLVQELPHSGTVELMHFISLAGDNTIAASVLVAIAASILLLMKAKREAIALIGTVLLGQVLKIVLKDLIGRPRPTPELVNVLFSAHEICSFPSGHTVFYTGFFGFLFFVAYTQAKPTALRWSLCVLFGGLIVLIGPARIFLGAHWVSDVIGGYLLGGAVLAAGIGCYRRTH